MAHLKESGIQTLINYPTALPFLPAYQHLGHGPADFPNARSHQSTIVSLPIFAEMTAAQQQRVVTGIARVLNRV